MDFSNMVSIAMSGLKAQSARMRVISQNIANADSTAASPDGTPYQRKVPKFSAVLDRTLGASSVKFSGVVPDRSPFGSRLDPGHPAADAKGFVKTPNVNTLVETVDMREAQRSYEANLNVVTAARRMITGTLRILSG